ncbi:putative F-box domain, leucine-rich repeat domain superfamily, F-box-like domain superfamily [Helianthus annuus]|uniref:F-box domain, leucine-rich repeat domain superfamily, F-box-like domain superfamily n=1 Tax=Helianthus annuus TaxID=4232 RepID=A0A9K3DV52_HELAN|nr:F-box/FBD/LRR-repeat protein At1g13570-like [Helianthus annuus]KAF5762076.1 putative F-box domain, leucine-rich repeat domain superfamily, F-box-like domain superfamily [Helianthus annuus]KAJ0462217.1 putative F-box domain, leucine-rich repeat domain superfamily, F-box-like domain superfamily [Helianthus annuus]KAJ0837892.1 putative F-box domain, leucine-rich repeat domain superfamily, F-box-like domain superfamily [Helianthus annuus]
MERIHGTLKASKFAPEDVISNMPNDVVTHILERLPLQDAVRTGILSRNWRFKWTMLSQLIFDDNFFEYLLETEGENNYGSIISSLIPHLKGVITKFVLYIEQRTYRILDDEDINHWILLLSKNGIKDLTFCKENGPRLKLPKHLFSCLELQHLKLVSCCFDPPASFNGFPNLLSLELRSVQFDSGKFGEFFTQCPVLETLNFGFTFPAGNVKQTEISKLANLKILSLLLFSLENTMITSSSSIFELVGSFPKLEELHLDFIKFKFTEGDAEKRFHTTFPCFKTLKLSRIDLCNGIMLSCAFEMIRSFPNLETLEITASYWDDSPTPGNCSLEVDFNTVGLLQLRDVVFTYLKGSENEVFLIKYLLACSPFLKKIVIHPHSCLASDEKLMFAMKLLKLHRASPVAEIDLCWF